MSEETDTDQNVTEEVEGFASIITTRTNIKHSGALSLGLSPSVAAAPAPVGPAEGIAIKENGIK